MLDCALAGKGNHLPLHGLDHRVPIRIDFNSDLGPLSKVLGVILKEACERAFHGGMPFIHQGFENQTLSNQRAVQKQSLTMM